MRYELLAYGWPSRISLPPHSLSPSAVRTVRSLSMSNEIWCDLIHWLKEKVPQYRAILPNDDEPLHLFVVG
jgi:hypothetical protein